KGIVVHIPTFGGTKNPKGDAIVAAGGDLVVMNGEEHRREDFESLYGRTDVLMTDILTVADALREMRRIGVAVGCGDASEKMCHEIESALPVKYATTIDVAYFIWRHPWMVAGGSTYINDVLSRFGMR